jgi:hypothetical protein
MPTKPHLAEAACKLESDLRIALASQDKSSQGTLKDRVREALLAILDDSDASAAAKASACRTLMQFFREENQTLSGRRGADMTAAELDSMIAGLSE